METITLILGSSVVAAFVTNLFTTHVANKKIEIENITQERAKWREKIRENACAVSKSILESNEKELLRLRSIFRLLLNPLDEEDGNIIKAITIAPADKVKEKEAEFTERVSLLLKHDWERAKFEALPWLQKCGEPKPTRRKYQEYSEKTKESSS